MKEVQNYKFSRSYSFGVCEYTIDHSSEVGDEYLRQLQILSNDIKIKKIFALLTLIGLISFQIVCSFAFSYNLFSALWLYILMIIFMVISTVFALYNFHICVDTEWSDLEYRKLENLFVESLVGIDQYNRAKEIAEYEIKVQRCKKIDKLIDTYDILDSTISKEVKIDLINKILEDE